MLVSKQIWFFLIQLFRKIFHAESFMTVKQKRHNGFIGLVLLMLMFGQVKAAAPATEVSPMATIVEEVKQQLPLLGQGTMSFYLENDMFTDTDENYTNGVRVSLSSPNLEKFDDEFIGNEQFRSWYEWLNRGFELFHPASPNSGGSDGGLSSRRVVLTLGQQIYTPSDSQATTTVEDQRPYAGWLYLGTYYHARQDDQLKSIGVNLGIVGPAALARESQDLIHDIRGIDKFKGWDNQLDNEPGLQLVFEKKDKLLDRAGTKLGYDFISHYGASLGNVATYANLGGEFRFGWNIPDDFGTSSLRSAADNHTPDGEKRSNWSLHSFISFDGRWVARDIFLDGNTFSDSHSVDKKNLVGDIATGISLTYKQLSFSYARISRSREYWQQDDAHHYGSLSVAWDYQF